MRGGGAWGGGQLGHGVSDSGISVSIVLLVLDGVGGGALVLIVEWWVCMRDTAIISCIGVGGRVRLSMVGMTWGCHLGELGCHLFPLVEVLEELEKLFMVGAGWAVLGGPGFFTLASTVGRGLQKRWVGLRGCGERGQEGGGVVHVERGWDGLL